MGISLFLSFPIPVLPIVFQNMSEFSHEFVLFFNPILSITTLYISVKKFPFFNI